MAMVLLCGVMAPVNGTPEGIGEKCTESYTKVTGYLDDQAYKAYYFDVPPGTKILTLRLSTGSDAVMSIYVRKGALAGPTSADASASVSRGSTEVTLKDPAKDRYWVQVRAASGGGSFTLTGVTTTMSGSTKKSSATFFNDDCCPEAVPIIHTTTGISCPAGSHWAFMDCTCTGVANIYGCVRDQDTIPQSTPALTKTPTKKPYLTKAPTKTPTKKATLTKTPTRTPTRSQTLAATPTANVARPATGTLVSGMVPSGGKGQFTIDNRQGSSDAVAVLTRSGSLAPVVAVYIRKGESYQFGTIPDATYLLYFVLGSDWDPAKKVFLTNPRYQKMVDLFPFTSDWDSYVVASVTLYGVEDGNTSPQGVGKEQFPVL